MHPLLFPLLFWTLGCSTAQGLTGPETARGQEMGSLMVACHYDPGWKTHKKYWCRGAQWSSCKILVTTKSEQLVKKDRVSIKDNQKSFVFTVTMENLRGTDAGTYWCGIERIGADHGFEVNVFIDPAPTTVLTTMPTITTTTAPILVEETSILPTSYHSDSRHSILELSVLLPVIAAAVLVLLLVMASLLAWRMTRRQKKAAGLPPEQAPQSLDGDLCYANLTLQQSRTDPGSSRKKVSTRTSSCGQTNQAEVAYVTMAPFPREEISYASLSLDNLDREPVYSNTDHLVTHIPSMSQEVSTEYSSIRRP